MGKAKMATEQKRLVEKKSDTSSSISYRSRTIHEIPNEMLDQILRKLSSKDKKAARRVSKRWYAAQELSVRYNIPLSNVTLSSFQKKKYNLNELRVVLNKLDIPEPIPSKLKRSIKTAKSLHFMADSVSRMSRNRKDKSWAGIDGNGVESLLKTCSSIETLKFDFRLMKVNLMTSVLDVKRVRLPFLKTLQMLLIVGSHSNVANAIFRLELPSLRNLEVESCSSPELSAEGDASVYSAMMQCVARHRSTLRGLRLIRFMTTRNTNVVLFRRGLDIELPQVHLESLEMDFKRTEIRSADWIGINLLLSNQRSLKTLKVHTDSFWMGQLVYHLILANANSLTHLELDVEDAANFNLNILSNLTALTTFSFTSNATKFGFFPPTLEHLTWNARLTQHWYSIEARALFPNLVTLTLGPSEPRTWFSQSLCNDLFGINPITNERTHTPLKLITILRYRTCVFRNFSLHLLPRDIFSLEYVNEGEHRVVRISLH